MMYQSKFIACLKANGKILREFNDTVRVPFGTEFSILLKNLNTVRAQVSISIDGESVTGESKIIVNSNEDFELTRYIKNRNLTSGNCFKFIERTASIEDYRGVRLDDGIIRVQFQVEHKPLPSIYINSIKPYRSYSSTSVYGINEVRSAVACDSSNNTGFMDQVNDAGITVPGSISNQQFQSIDNFPVESETHVIVLKMIGIVGNGQLVTQPVTVKVQNICQTCGKVNKINSKYCSECATNLVVI